MPQHKHSPFNTYADLTHQYFQQCMTIPTPPPTTDTKKLSKKEKRKKEKREEREKKRKEDRRSVLKSMYVEELDRTIERITRDNSTSKLKTLEYKEKIAFAEELRELGHLVAISPRRLFDFEREITVRDVEKIHESIAYYENLKLQDEPSFTFRCSCVHKPLREVTCMEEVDGHRYHYSHIASLLTDNSYLEIIKARRRAITQKEKKEHPHPLVVLFEIITNREIAKKESEENPPNHDHHYSVVPVDFAKKPQATTEHTREMEQQYLPTPYTEKKHITDAYQMPLFGDKESKIATFEPLILDHKGYPIPYNSGRTAAIAIRMYYELMLIIPWNEIRYGEYRFRIDIRTLGQLIYGNVQRPRNGKIYCESAFKPKRDFNKIKEALYAVRNTELAGARGLALFNIPYIPQQEEETGRQFSVICHTETSTPLSKGGIYINRGLVRSMGRDSSANYRGTLNTHAYLDQHWTQGKSLIRKKKQDCIRKDGAKVDEHGNFIIVNKGKTKSKIYDNTYHPAQVIDKDSEPYNNPEYERRLNSRTLETQDIVKIVFGKDAKVNKHSKARAIEVLSKELQHKDHKPWVVFRQLDSETFSLAPRQGARDKE